jgi:ADP-heptose:LPS heptosyltransferase
VKPTVAIKLFAPGIGDLVVLGPVLYNLKARNIVDKIILIVYNEGQLDLAGRMPWIDATYIDDGLFYVEDRTFFIDMSEHPLEKIWWGSEEYIQKFGQTHVIHMMEKIIGGMGLPKEYPSLTVNKLGINPKVVLLAPGGRRATKLLPTQTWLDIHRHLELSGYHPYLIGSKGHKGSEQIQELLNMGIGHLDFPNLGQVIDCINESAGMISIDNGLYHISSYLNKPTVGLFGPMQPWLWGGIGYKTRNLQNYCPINCTSTPLEWECVGHPCMKGFTGKQIVETFLGVI